jgi:hypothetical protein
MSLIGWAFDDRHRGLEEVPLYRRHLRVEIRIQKRAGENER